MIVLRRIGMLRFLDGPLACLDYAELFGHPDGYCLSVFADETLEVTIRHQ